MSSENRCQGGLTLKQQTYIESIGELQHRHGHAHVTELAAALEVSKPSVVQMLGRLAQTGMIKKDGCEIRLTRAGQRFVGELSDTQALLEDLLVGELGMRRKAARTDACRLEHVVSSALVRSLRAYLKEHRNL
jgi:DtxR family transcriptional regulator, Mn-dependent transcriptional regulator